MKPRPQLNEVPVPADMAAGKCFITIDPGAWDGLIEAAYRMGWTLLEIENEVAVRAFRKPTP